MLYWILITRGNDNAIVSLYSHELQLELLNEEGPISHDFDYRTHVINFFKQRDMPLNIEQCDIQTLMKQNITILQHWEPFDISFDDNNRCCAKLLPITGQLANILAIISGGFVTFMALQISSLNQNQSKASDLESLSIIGAILDSISLLIIYHFSDANKILFDVGNIFDKVFYKSVAHRASINNNKDEQRYLKLFLSIVAILFVFSNTIVASIRRYQEIVILTDKFLEISNTFKQDQRDIINLLVADLYTFSMAYSGIAFQGSFSFKFINSLQKKLQSKGGELYFRNINPPLPRENEPYRTTDESRRLIHM